MKKILAFAGSNSPESINYQLVKHSLIYLNKPEVLLIDLRDFPLIIYGSEVEKKDGVPENAQRLKRLILTHDAFIIAVPEHNGSLTAVFKNTIDWISRSGESYRLLENKPIVLLSTSPSPGGGRNAVAHAESVLTRLAGKIVGKVSIPSFYKNISTENGFEIKNGQYQLQLNEAIIQLGNELMNNDSERLQKMINALN